MRLRRDCRLPAGAFVEVPVALEDERAAVRTVRVGGELVFAASNSVAGRELWTSDGTEAGTVRIEDINPGPADSFPLPPPTFTRVGGTVFFRASDGVTGTELWALPIRLTGAGASDDEDAATYSAGYSPDSPIRSTSSTPLGRPALRQRT